MLSTVQVVPRKVSTFPAAAPAMITGSVWILSTLLLEASPVTSPANVTGGGGATGKSLACQAPASNVRTCFGCGFGALTSLPWSFLTKLTPAGPCTSPANVTAGAAGNAAPCQALFLNVRTKLFFNPP